MYIEVNQPQMFDWLVFYIKLNHEILILVDLGSMT